MLMCYNKRVRAFNTRWYDERVRGDTSTRHDVPASTGVGARTRRARAYTDTDRRTCVQARPAELNV